LTFFIYNKIFIVLAFAALNVCLHITVLLIHRRVIVATCVYQGVGHSLILVSACGGAGRNTEEATSACLSHSVATFFYMLSNF
jgi:hypothetical protein